MSRAREDSGRGLDHGPAEDESRLPERAGSLWRLIAGPILWAVHFVACYATVAVWCAKVVEVGAPLGFSRTLVLIYTAVALAGIALSGWRGLKHHRYGTATLPHDADTPADRHRFLGFSTLLLAGLSFVATIYVASIVLFVETCR